MGLLQKACETYEFHKNLAGVFQEGRETLAPRSHKMTRADLEITVNEKGEFVSAAELDRDAPKIVIPVTEASAGRSGKNPPPHPTG